jgi:hypothetical protein
MLDTRTDLEASYTTYTQAYLPKLDAGDGKALQETFAPIVASVAALDAERSAVKSSTQLTAEGKGVALDALLTGKHGAAAAQQIAGAERRAQSVVEEIARLENNAAPPRVVLSNGQRFHDAACTEKRSSFDELRERELRDRLLGLKDYERRELYLKAVESGDMELVRAVELAPTSFPVIDAATIAEVRRQRIESSPSAPRLAQLRTLREAYGVLVDAARRQLGG